MSNRFRWILALPLLICVLWSFIYGSSYLNIVSSPHAYEQASRWMYLNCEPGSKILNVHWDDHLPIHLPGLYPEKFGYQLEDRKWELPLYESDNSKKIKDISTQLAAADYLVFPTARLYDSIPRLPQEYPYTTNFLRLIFADQLGYKLVQTFKTRPRIGSWVFNDDLADESISVYDHPKSAVFKNVGRLSAAQLEESILNVRDASLLPTLEQMLKRDAGDVPSTEFERQSVLLQFILWILIIELLSLLVLPYLLTIFSESFDGGVGLSYVLGLLCIGYISWLAQSCNIITGTSPSIWFVVCIFAILSAYFYWREQYSIQEAWSNKWHTIRDTKILFYFVFLIFCFIRACQPAIFWGEKPMDFSFLNFFIRNEKIPPMDPWAAGHTMHYYYLGTYFMALLHKLSGVDAAIGYNLALPTIAAMMVCAVSSTLATGFKGRFSIFAGACVVILISNFEWIKLHYIDGKVFNFDLFWATSRLYTSPAITEYPFWSLLFADLHAHVIAMPFVIATVLLCCWCMYRLRPAFNSKFILCVLLFVCCWGSLFVLNTWDFISIGFILGATAFCAFLRAFVEQKPKLYIVLSPFVFVGAALLSISVFLGASGSTERVGYGWVQQEEFNNFSQLMRHLGHWLLPMGFGVVFLPLQKRNWNFLELWKPISVAIPIGFVPFALGLWSTLSGTIGVPWQIIMVSSLLMAGAVVLVLVDESFEIFVASVCLLVSGFLITASELIFLMDHMNTIFKFYNAIWIFAGIAAVILTIRTIHQLWSHTALDWAEYSLRSTSIIILLGFAVGLVGTLIHAYTMSKFERIEGPNLTLRGTDYIQSRDADEAALIQWINSHINGTPTLLEAQGDSYGSFTRLTMNTGLPTVLGWEHHVMQRGLPHQSQSARKQAVRRIYSTLDVNEAYRLLKQFQVELIAVGELERTTYGIESLKKFCQRPDLFPVLFESGKTRLYATDFSALGHAGENHAFSDQSISTGPRDSICNE